MAIDEHALEKELTCSRKNYQAVKDVIKEIVIGDLTNDRASDLLRICELSGLSPNKALGLYQLVYDGISEGDLDGKEKAHSLISSTGIDQLVLDDSKKIMPASRGYRLQIDSNYTFRIIMISDTHIGAEQDNIDGIAEMFDRAEAVGAKAVFHSGDLLEGNFAHRDQYLHVRDDCKTSDAQLDRFVKEWPKRAGIKTYFIAGNHDHFFQKPFGYDICRHIAQLRDDLIYLKEESVQEAFNRQGCDPEELKEIIRNKKAGSGRIGAVRIGPYHLPDDQKNTIIMMMHPDGGSAQTISYRPQIIIKNLDWLLMSFENMTNHLGRKIKPHIIQIGHYHKADAALLRNVEVIQAGTMKMADEFHETRNLQNMMGYWIIELTTKKDGDLVKMGKVFQRAYVDPTRYTRRVISMK